MGGRSQSELSWHGLTLFPNVGHRVLNAKLWCFAFTANVGTDRQKYPKIILDVELTNHISDGTQNEVDISIRATSVLPDGAVVRKVSGNQFVLLASPEYLDGKGVPAKAEELLSHQTLLYRGPDGILHWHAQTAGNGEN